MDIEDRIRDVVREDQRTQPSLQFHGRVMANLPDRPALGRRMVLGFPGLLKYTAVAVVVIVAVGAVGLPMMVSRSVSAGPASGASRTDEDVASSSPNARPTASPSTVEQIVSAPPGSISPGKIAPPVASTLPSTEFTPTGSADYLYGSSTLLADGRVLFAGGFDSPPGFLAAATLYDPATGKFTPTGSMATARADVTATRLLDGRVLVVGGLGSDYFDLSVAEIYDPATGKFTPTGSLQTARQFHSATLLKDGRVLIAGGFREPVASVRAGRELTAPYRPGLGGGTSPNTMTVEAGLLASAEIYDPKTGKFTAAGTMTHARDNLSSTLLPDGRVLIFGNTGGGGDGGDAATDKTAEIFDPQTGRFTATGSLNFARTNPNATVLKDGRILITGGSSDGKSSEIYDPATGKFSLTGSLNTARSEFPATLLSDGRVLIAGGFVTGIQATASVELYDPATGKFTDAGWMTAARASALATLLPDGRVLIAGGIYIGPGGWVGIHSAELYQP